MLAGAPMTQATTAEPLAKSGETCVSPEAWALISSVAHGVPVSEGEPTPPEPSDPPPLASAESDSFIATPRTVSSIEPECENYMLVCAVQPDAFEQSLPGLPPLASLRLTTALLPLMRRRAQPPPAP